MVADAEPPVDDQEYFSAWALLIQTSLLAGALWTSYYLQIKKIRAVHETVVSIFAGMFVGLIIRVSPGLIIQKMVTFNHTYFFNLLLPPIILNSGYELKRENFFRNFGTILTFALIGTFISALVTGFLVAFLGLIGIVTLSFLDSMIFGAILSATDPVTVLAIFQTFKVDPKLYSVIFGESILNDAVAIVLYETLKQFRGQELHVSNVIRGIGTFLARYRKRAEHLPHAHQVMLFWAGLRGAVAFALAAGLVGEHAFSMRTTILVVVVLSVIVFGGTTSRMLEIMRIRTGVEDEDSGDSDYEESLGGNKYDAFEDVDHRHLRSRAVNGNTTFYFNHSPEDSLGSADSIMSVENNGLLTQSSSAAARAKADQAHWFISFDNRFLKPLFSRHKTDNSSPAKEQWRHENLIQRSVVRGGHRIWVMGEKFQVLLERGLNCHQLIVAPVS
ncbi:8319_t:CDS:2 [Ambispora gerdemannii]|uniref:8319_t:CDS:1 n=1 Tax=Ambispora gerdemannii TaxID=144530 RepID=A0A9N8V9S5_9GLOM|nr:8319_t:CDS:2 [Ambispora gerdemannii]